MVNWAAAATANLGVRMTKATNPNSAAMSGLAQPFVDAMGKLFEILDKDGDGLVSLGDISSKWQAQNNPSLPRNVVANLKKVTNAEGMLTFERFCAGLAPITEGRDEIATVVQDGGDGEEDENFLFWRPC